MTLDKKVKILTLVFLFLIPRVFASEIDSGVAWLKVNQDADGSWDGTPAGIDTKFETTAFVAGSLRYLGITDSNLLNAINWIYSADVTSTRYLALKVESLTGTDKDFTQAKDILISFQNTDGGWGIYQGYESDVFDTILVTDALKSANALDTTAIQKIIDWLLLQQNPDGGWGYTLDTDSNIYITAQVLILLSDYQSTFNLSANIDNAASWFLTQQNPDGSFGTSIFETALAYSALVRTTIAHTQIQQTLEYIKSMQLENGSWNNDAFETALALRALADAKPNLIISSGDIVFSPASVYEGYRVRITATVRNSSVVEASNVVVRFYLGLPSDNIQIGTEQTISSIAGGSVGMIEVEWDTTGHAGVNDIYVVVDPDDAYFNPANPTEEDTMIITGLVGNQGQKWTGSGEAQITWGFV